ncbi:MAG: hypothetical protein K8I30_01960 [Anaerolineae bacterium]|nr:hypothetical protein [Anaerolineae bacterium]
MQKLLLTIITLLMMIGGVAGAQDMGPVVRNTYYLAADANGVQQVFHASLSGESEARQITRATADIITFGAAYDNLSVAYISGGQLWLQPIHTEEAEALAQVSSQQFFKRPVYSQDGEYIAYADGGVWLLDLGTRETRQILVDVPMEALKDSTADFRLYQPQQFARGADGRETKLIVDVGIWEWNSDGVYDLETGELQVLEGYLHTDILPLYGGKVLLYGNGGVAGEPALHLAESLDDINTFTEVVKFAALTDTTLFATQAVEIRPGVVRVAGPALTMSPDEVSVFYFDYDLMANEAGEVHFVTLSKGGSGNVVIGTFSPDGSLLNFYTDPLWTDAGSIYGQLQIVDVATGETVPTQFPATVSIFHWQK